MAKEDVSNRIQSGTLQKLVLTAPFKQQWQPASSENEDLKAAEPQKIAEEQTLRAHVINTFLLLKGEHDEAQKAQQMKWSCSDLSFGPQCPSDKECDCSQGAGLNTAALGRDQLQFRNAPSQSADGRHVRSSRDSHGRLQCVLSLPFSPCTSDSSLDLDRILGPRAESPNIVPKDHWDGQRSTDQDAVPGPNRSTWSAGAAGHEEGNCKPCAWNWKPMGCSNAASCQYCHMCPKDTFKEQKKAVMLKLKNLKKVAKAANVPPGPAALQPGLIQEEILP